MRFFVSKTCPNGGAYPATLGAGSSPVSMSSSVPSRSPLTALMRGSASISSSVHHVQSCPVDAEFDSAAQAVEWLRDHGHARRRIGRHQRCVQQPETHRLRVQLAVRRPINKKQPRSSHHGWRVGRGCFLRIVGLTPRSWVYSVIPYLLHTQRLCSFWNRISGLHHTLRLGLYATPNAAATVGMAPAIADRRMVAHSGAFAAIATGAATARITPKMVQAT